jgi:plastocyanin
MARYPIAIVALPVVMVLVASCSDQSAAGQSPGSTSAPPSPPATASATPSTPAPSVSPSASASVAPSVGVAGSPDPSICVASTGTAVVKVAIEDFDFQPATIQAETGEVIMFSNTGFESHNATLDSGACRIPTLETGGRHGLVFKATGSFPFHCSIHTWMTGTIVISAAASREDRPLGARAGGGSVS